MSTSTIFFVNPEIQGNRAMDKEQIKLLLLVIILKCGGLLTQQLDFSNNTFSINQILKSLWHLLDGNLSFD